MIITMSLVPIHSGYVIDSVPYVVCYIPAAYIVSNEVCTASSLSLFSPPPSVMWVS